MRAVVQTAQLVLTTQLRVDENELRRQTADAMPRILAAIERVEKGLPPLKTAPRIDR
jgi:hypothetical protein